MKSQRAMNNNNQHTFLGYLALFSLLGGLGLIFGATHTLLAQVSPTTQGASALQAIVPPLDFSEVNIVADAAYVFDIPENKVVFSKNDKAQLPLASIVKISVALLAYEHVDLDSFITVSESSLAPEGDWGFVVGDVWEVRDLIDYTLVTSSNDGAALLAEKIEEKTGEGIVRLLNQQAQSIGLAQTFFLNETGLDSSTALGGAYGSAKDIGTLFAYAYSVSPNLFAATTVIEATYTSKEGMVYDAKNTNKAIGQLPGLVFGKTGFTDLAGGNLAVITESEPGHTYVIVVLASTVEDRFDDVISLSRATLRKPIK